LASPSKTLSRSFPVLIPATVLARKRPPRGRPAAFDPGSRPGESNSDASPGRGGIILDRDASQLGNALNTTADLEGAAYHADGLKFSRKRSGGRRWTVNVIIIAPRDVFRRSMPTDCDVTNHLTRGRAYGHKRQHRQSHRGWKERGQANRQPHNAGAKMDYISPAAGIPVNLRRDR